MDKGSKQPPPPAHSRQGPPQSQGSPSMALQYGEEGGGGGSRLEEPQCRRHQRICDSKNGHDPWAVGWMGVGMKRGGGGKGCVSGVVGGGGGGGQVGEVQRQQQQQRPAGRPVS